MDTRPIGVFDSGLGGLTALRELAALLPGEDLLYFGDTGRVPYGSRGAEIITRYAQEDAAFLLDQGVKAVLLPAKCWDVRPDFCGTGDGIQGLLHAREACCQLS